MNQLFLIPLFSSSLLMMSCSPTNKKSSIPQGTTSMVEELQKEKAELVLWHNRSVRQLILYTNEIITLEQDIKNVHKYAEPRDAELDAERFTKSLNILSQKSADLEKKLDKSQQRIDEINAKLYAIATED